MRGIKERVILWRHVLPNVMLPLVTLLGLSLGSLLGGTAVVEIIYNWPGMGNMAVKAISCRVPGQDQVRCCSVLRQLP